MADKMASREVYMQVIDHSKVVLADIDKHLTQRGFLGTYINKSTILKHTYMSINHLKL